MFVKPFKTKSNNQLKSSDRKKVKQKVASVYPHITDQQLDEIFPSKVTGRRAANIVMVYMGLAWASWGAWRMETLSGTGGSLPKLIFLTI